MLDRDYPEQLCSVARALEVVGERWTLLIVRDLMFGGLRFDELLASVGTTPAMLTRRLRGLIADEVVEQRPYQDRPRRYEYHLTDKGRGLFDVLAALMHWGDRHYGPAPRLLMHQPCGRALDSYLTCAHCGERAQTHDIERRLGPGAESAAGPSGR
ncbi:MAG TPA: helix-turn-helix domain-containing protein [Pseudonocardia sp.]|jgi:DNA-binding HxlR family transcriptional regulator|nr:helix-turn-helix domain-containing protein [Pseudonocardia sp.]